LLENGFHVCRFVGTVSSGIVSVSESWMKIGAFPFSFAVVLNEVDGNEEEDEEEEEEAVLVAAGFGSLLLGCDSDGR
jgi:hypothetical protein